TGYWSIGADDLEAEPQPVWPREEGVEYSVEHAVVGGEDRVLITHNRNRAAFALVDVPAADPTADPRPVIAEVAGLRIQDVASFADFTAIRYRRGVFARVRRVRLDNAASSPLAAVHVLPFGRETRTLLPAGHPECAQTSIRLLFPSMSTPSLLYPH